MERETGIEPATFSLARRCSTTEPLPLVRYVCETKIAYQGRFVNKFLTLVLTLIAFLYSISHSFLPTLACFNILTKKSSPMSP